MSTLNVLATRLLSNEEKLQIEALGCQVDQIASIAVELLNFQMPKKLTDAIFTSQNAIKSFLNHPMSQEKIVQGIRVYCVGEKTAELATHSGFKVQYWANNSQELAQMISEKDADKSLLYFSGSISMRALVEGLNQDGIHYREVVVYKTSETQPQLEKNYDLILFFSPSGVRSIQTQNDISSAVKVCIGPTTAREFNTNNNIIIADYPPSFNHIIKAIKQYKQ